jgi:hypothetical protein
MNQDRGHDSGGGGRDAWRHGRARRAAAEDGAVLESLYRIVRRVMKRGRATSALDRQILALTRAVGQRRRFPPTSGEGLWQAVAGVIAMRLRGEHGRGRTAPPERFRARGEGVFDTTCGTAFPTELEGG